MELDSNLKIKDMMGHGYLKSQVMKMELICVGVIGKGLSVMISIQKQG